MNDLNELQVNEIMQNRLWFSLLDIWYLCTEYSKPCFRVVAQSGVAQAQYETLSAPARVCTSVTWQLRPSRLIPVFPLKSIQNRVSELISSPVWLPEIFRHWSGTGATFDGHPANLSCATKQSFCSQGGKFVPKCAQYPTNCAQYPTICAQYLTNCAHATV